MSFKDDADQVRRESVQAQQSAEVTGQVNAQNEASLRSALDQYLNALGAEASAYLKNAGVEPLPIGKVHKPLPMTRTERLLNVRGHAWPLDFRICLDIGGQWSVRGDTNILKQHFLGNDRSRRTPQDYTVIGRSLNVNGASLANVLRNHDAQGSALSGEIELGREHKVGLRFTSTGALWMEEYTSAHPGPAFDFRTWVVTTVGEMAAR